MNTVCIELTFDDWQNTTTTNKCSAKTLPNNPIITHESLISHDTIVRPSINMCCFVIQLLDSLLAHTLTVKCWLFYPEDGNQWVILMSAFSFLYSLLHNTIVRTTITLCCFVIQLLESLLAHTLNFKCWLFYPDDGNQWVIFMSAFSFLYSLLSVYVCEAKTDSTCSYRCCGCICSDDSDSTIRFNVRHWCYTKTEIQRIIISNHHTLTNMSQHQ